MRNQHLIHLRWSHKIFKLHKTQLDCKIFLKLWKRYKCEEKKRKIFVDTGRIEDMELLVVVFYGQSVRDNFCSMTITSKRTINHVRKSNNKHPQENPSTNVSLSCCERCGMWFVWSTNALDHLCCRSRRQWSEFLTNQKVCLLTASASRFRMPTDQM